MDNKIFATELYEFLKANDTHGYYEKAPAEDAIAELENYLSDLQMVKETIKDIEEVADTFDDHEYYITEVKPLVKGLRDIQEKLEAEQSKRMVGDTNYEVKHAIHIGDREIVFAEDKKEETGMCFFVSDHIENDIFGKYENCEVSDDFLEAMQEFTNRVNKQIETMKSEINKNNIPRDIFTAEHCYPNDYTKSIDGKVVAIKAEIFRPEYKRGDVQLVLVSGGNGAKANPNGNAVFCYHLNNGKHTRFERYDVQGEVKPECMPEWAKERLTAVKAQIDAERNKSAKSKEDAR
jgi:hypothetical protein